MIDSGAIYRQLYTYYFAVLWSSNSSFSALSPCPETIWLDWDQSCLDHGETSLISNYSSSPKPSKMKQH